MWLTTQKSKQRDRSGEVSEGPPGSTLEHGMSVEKYPRTWEVPYKLLIKGNLEARHTASETRRGNLETELCWSLNDKGELKNR